MNITPVPVGTLTGRAWRRAASVEMRNVEFRATGICPFNPNTIPVNFFAFGDDSLTQWCPSSN
jgi:hypothetical protein